MSSNAVRVSPGEAASGPRLQKGGRAATRLQLKVNMKVDNKITDHKRLKRGRQHFDDEDTDRINSIKNTLYSTQC